MAPKTKLVYFNVTGLGEPIRYMLAYGKIQYEDSRVEFAEFEKIKPTTPFGKLPVLEIDGKEIHQSAAICRYLSKLSGIAGKSDWDQLQADIAVDTFTDFRMNYTTWFREKDEAAKAVKYDELMNTHNPYYLGKFDKIVKDNGGYLVNGQLTWADIFVSSILEMLTNISKAPILDAYPSLQALKEKVENLPGIKEYRATRPKTDL